MEETKTKRDAMGDTRIADLWTTSDFALQEFKKSGKIENCHICKTELDMTSTGWTKVGQVEVRILAIITGEELVMREIDSLKAQIEEEKRGHAGRITWLEDKLANLLCLPAPKTETPVDLCEWSEE